MIMIVISFVLVKFYAFAILYVLIVMQIKLVVVVVFLLQEIRKNFFDRIFPMCTPCWRPKTTLFAFMQGWERLFL